MASIYEVADVIQKLQDGFKDECLECMDVNRSVIVDCIREQLYCGVDGNGDYLSPNYDNDPYFTEDGPWKGRSQQYKEWKKRVTPPVYGPMLALSPRPDEIPNLFITGTFHDSISAIMEGESVHTYTKGFRDGPQIESKYGESIFYPGADAREYFIIECLIPSIKEFFGKCGYVVQL